MKGSVHLEKKNKIGRIKFFHPKGNSLPSDLLQKLIKGEDIDVEKSGLSKREWNELMTAFNIKDKLI